MSVNYTVAPERARIDPKTLKVPAGKGVNGETGQLPVPAVSNSDFMKAVFRQCPQGALAVVCSKQGDPQNGAWIAEAITNVDEQCPPQRNNYFNCSTFLPNENAEVRAQKI